MTARLPMALDRVIAQRRLAVAACLNRLAERLTLGDLQADAVLIVLSEGDIHRPFWQGHYEWPRLNRATNAVSEEASRQRGWGCSPEENAARRVTLVQKEREKVEAYEREHPHACICSDRFKSRRGLDQHIGRTRYGQHGVAPIPETPSFQVVP